MLEYLDYALFAVVMIGCLIYVMTSLETEETPLQKQQNSEVQARRTHLPPNQPPPRTQLD